MSFVPFWTVFELLYRWRIRGLLPCQQCGFDPYLFKIDVQKAKQEVDAHWRKKFADKGIPYPERKPKQDRKPRSPYSNPEQSLRVPLLGLILASFVVCGGELSASAMEKTGQAGQSSETPRTLKGQTILQPLGRLRAQITQPGWAKFFKGDPIKDPEGTYAIMGNWNEADIQETAKYYQADPGFAEGYLIANKGVLGYVRGAAREETRLFYKIVDAKTKAAVGVISFRELREAPVVSYFLNSKYWGKNITALAIEAALPEIFQSPQVKVIKADTNYDNEASKRVLTKLGFKQVLMPKGAEPGDYFELSREEYLRTRTDHTPQQPSPSDPSPMPTFLNLVPPPPRATQNNPRVSERENRLEPEQSVSGSHESGGSSSNLGK